MKFTGSNTLQTPRVSQVTYQLDSIVVDSTGLYAIQTRQAIPFSTGLNTTALFSLVSGIVLDPSGRFVSTYNTGEPFSVSGWMDYASSYRYFAVGKDILSRTPDATATTGLLTEFVIACPTSGSLTCDVTLKSTRLTESVAFAPSFYINRQETGVINASHCMYVTNDSFQFYQSYETLLTGGPLVAFVDTRLPTTIKYYDNDSSEQNNVINMNYEFDTSYRKVITSAVINRTGLYSSGIFELVDVSESGIFSGEFGGIWSGNQFVYQDDTPNSITLSFYVNKSDSQGVVYPSTIGWTAETNIQPTMLPAEYITGFRLTNSGAYANPPLIECSGYYYCTGIKQSISSLLFTTGCTGNIVVTFSGGGGTGASGFIQLQPVLFSGVYVNGQRWYNVPYNYFTSGIGTGYVTPPKAYINTGMYGSQCYDVPRASGYNQAWFSPFDTSGTMDLEAGWFTGVALYVTGITGNGLTGLFVTGIDVYNIGTGYSAIRPPRLVFVRTGVDGGRNNASGILYTKTGSANPISGWKFEYSVGGSTWIQTGSSSSNFALPDNNHYFNVRLSISGSDITVPLTGYVRVSQLGGASVVSPYTYVKYFDTGTDALKKKDNPVSVFSINSDLSYSLSQNDLDTLYSSAGYTDNNWPFTEGDFDF